ncbi:MAG TPA: flagellar hook-length control protein FliK, partial [Rhizomicrobium sp.]|nr:flagellar hook-length control protein FliK [Rhizomicrobium sp.]
AAASTGIKPQTDVKLPAGNKLETKPGINADAPTGTPAKMPPKPAITAQTPAPTDDSGDDTSDTQIAEPAAQAAVKMAAPLPAQNAPDTQTAPAAGSQSGVAQNSGVTNTDAAPQTTAQLPRDAAAQANAAKTDTTDPVPASEGNSEGKSPALKNTTSKTRTVQADVASKPANSDVPKSDAPKTTEPQLDTVTAASAPKAAPQPAPHDVFAVNAIAAPQAPSSPVATATANAHVHVSAEASPDLPSLAVAIAGKSQSGAKQFDIRLDPPELGRVEVRLSIDATGKASAHLSADQPQTLSLLQKDAPVLTRALRDAGLDVSQDGLNFSLRQQAENQNGNAGNNGRRGSSRAFALNASISIDATAGSAAYRAAANGRLDIRV